jgi:hypothetical protein
MIASNILAFLNGAQGYNDRLELVIGLANPDYKVDIVVKGVVGETLLVIWGDGEITETTFDGEEQVITHTYDSPGDVVVIITGNRAAVLEIDLGVLDTEKEIPLKTWFPNLIPVGNPMLMENDDPILTEDEMYLEMEAA